MTTRDDVPGVLLVPLTDWLVGTGMLGATTSLPVLTPIVGGASNVTVRLQTPEVDWVLRRPPLRGGLPGAHDMLREHRLQCALRAAADEQGHDLPLATMVTACEDTSVLGAPFYLMEHLDGIVHTPRTIAAADAEEVHAVGLALAGGLARLHEIDPTRSEVFAEFARPEPYVDRQLRRWTKQWEKARAATGLGGEPAIDRVFARLAATRPMSPPVRVVHGDYGIANVLYRADAPTELQAILDWELTSLGDALGDLGTLCSYFGDAGRILNEGRAAPVCHPSTQPALPTPEELAEHYATNSSVDLSALRWYVALATVRLAVIVAGALARLDPTAETGSMNRSTLIARIRNLAEAADAELAG